MLKKNETEKDIELIYNVAENEKIDNVSIGMMRNNDIKNLIPIDIVMHDSMTEFKYKTATVKNLNEYLSEELTKEELLDIFGNICKAVMDIEEYMLSESQIILENEYIFVDNETIKMVLLPIYDRKNSISIPTFFKNLLLDMMVKNDKAAYFAADISKQISEQDSLSYDKFLQLISELKHRKYSETPNRPKMEAINEFKERKINNIEEPVRPVTPAVDYSGYSNRAQVPVNTQPPVSTFKPVNSQPVSNVNVNAKPAKEEKKKGLFGFGKSEKKQEMTKVPENTFSNGNSFLIPGREEPVNVGTTAQKETKDKKKFSLFGKKKEKQAPKVENTVQVSKPQGSSFAETTVLQSPVNNMGETTLLGFSQNIANGFLIWKRTGEKILINKSNFRIGREKSYVDFCISDNTSVGRNHAEIIRKDGSFFIRDLKSLNSTMVNGEKISSTVEVELWDNDVISLANEEFEFHIG